MWRLSLAPTAAARLDAEETNARDAITAACEARRGAAVAHARHVLGSLVEERICLLSLAEPRRRRDVALAWLAETERLSSFFWFKLGDALRDATVLERRRSCALLWMQQAFERNAMAALMGVRAEELAAKRELGRAIYLSARQAAAATAEAARNGGVLAGQSPRMARRRRADEERLADERRLAMLLAERRRGIAAAMLHEFTVAHDASRIRLEWEEAAGRRRIEAAPVMSGAGTRSRSPVRRNW